MLANSLTPPGDSESYRNPDNRADGTLSIGDWITAKPGKTNAASVRNALNELRRTDIIVPLWNKSRGNGNNLAFRTAGFARLRLISYSTAPENTITVRFLSATTCDWTAPPTATARHKDADRHRHKNSNPDRHENGDGDRHGDRHGHKDADENSNRHR